MKIAIQRHGILIRTVDVESNARIGSAPECEIALDDPYLAAHVADIVRREDEWFIVDSGQSLEGITRDGSRIDDEPLHDRGVYVVGGFELVPQFPPAAWGGITDPDATYRLDFPRTMMEGDMAGEAAFPGTMSEPSSDEIPGTMFETPNPDAIAQSEVTPSARPVTPAGAAEIAPAPGDRKRLFRIVAIGLAAAILLLIVVIVAGGGKKEPVVASTETTATAATSQPAAPSAAELEQKGTALIATLNYENGLRLWEAAIEAGGPPALRERYAVVASDVARVHAASRDAVSAKSYYEKVVKYGPADSETVRIARERLQQ